MDADDLALLALEKEAAKSDPNWHGGSGGDGDGDDEMEAEMKREEARVAKMLRNPNLAGIDTDDLDDLASADQVHDDDVLGELDELAKEVHAERGASGSMSLSGTGSKGDHHELDADALFAAAEAEANAMDDGDLDADLAPAPSSSSIRATSNNPSQQPATKPQQPQQPAARPAHLTSSSSNLASSSPSVAPLVAASTASPDSIPALTARLLTLKQQAVELNRAGRKPEALDVMRNIKAIQAKITQLQGQQAQQAPMNAARAATTATTPANAARKPAPTPTSQQAQKPTVAPRPAVTPSSSSSSSSSATSSSSSKLSIRHQLEYDSLLQQLDAQIASLAESMKRVVATGGGGTNIKADSKEAKLLALQYFAAKKRSVKDREILALAKSRDLKPPATHQEELVIQQELSFPNLTDDQIEVTITGGRDLHNAKICSKASDLVPLVSVALEYAVDVDGNMKTGSQQWTPALKGATPVWNHVFTIALPFTRTNLKDKLAVKKLLRSRILIGLHHKRFLLGTAEVARAEVKLKELHVKSEVVSALKLKDPSGSGRCGELDVTVRMRRPLEGIDLRQTKQTILVVDEFEETDSTAAQPTAVQQQAAPTAVTPAVSTPVAASSAITTSSSSVSVTTQQPTATVTSTAAVSSATAPAPAADGVPVITGDPHAISKMRSNDLLEAEIVLLTQQLGKLKQTPAKFDADGVNETEHAMDETNDKITAAKIQLEVLVTMVQNGKLSLEDYLANLKKDMAEETKLARQLMLASRKVDAARVLERVKIMKAEVANAEENQEELAQC